MTYKDYVAGWQDARAYFGITVGNKMHYAECHKTLNPTHLCTCQAHDWIPKVEVMYEEESWS